MTYKNSAIGPCVELSINLAAGHFHSLRFFYGDEQIKIPDVTSWDLNPKNGYRIESDWISKMNANGSGYSTDFIWVTIFSQKFYLSITIKLKLNCNLFRLVRFNTFLLFRVQANSIQEVSLFSIFDCYCK